MWIIMGQETRVALRKKTSSLAPNTPVKGTSSVRSEEKSEEFDAPDFLFMFQDLFSLFSVFINKC